MYIDDIIVVFHLYLIIDYEKLKFTQFYYILNKIQYIMINIITFIYGYGAIDYQWWKFIILTN